MTKRRPKRRGSKPDVKRGPYKKSNRVVIAIETAYGSAVIFEDDIRPSRGMRLRPAQLADRLFTSAEISAKLQRKYFPNGHIPEWWRHHVIVTDRATARAGNLPGRGPNTVIITCNRTALRKQIIRVRDRLMQKGDLPSHRGRGSFKQSWSH